MIRILMIFSCMFILLSCDPPVDHSLEWAIGQYKEFVDFNPPTNITSVGNTYDDIIKIYWTTEYIDDYFVTNSDGRKIEITTFFDIYRSRDIDNNYVLVSYNSAYSRVFINTEKINDFDYSYSDRFYDYPYYRKITGPGTYYYRVKTRQYMDGKFGINLCPESEFSAFVESSIHTTEVTPTGNWIPITDNTETGSLWLWFDAVKDKGYSIVFDTDDLAADIFSQGIEKVNVLDVGTTYWSEGPPYPNYGQFIPETYMADWKDNNTIPANIIAKATEIIYIRVFMINQQNFNIKIIEN
jgi:hypothetical protein